MITSTIVRFPVFVVPCVILTACQAFLSFGSDDVTAAATTDASAGDGASIGNGDAAATNDAAARDSGAPENDAAADAGTCPPNADAGALCPDGGVVWNGRCYFTVPSLNFRIGDARNACLSSGARLATFTCAAEWSAAKDAVRQPDIFLTDGDWNGSAWEWGSGEPFTFSPFGQLGSGDAVSVLLEINGKFLSWNAGSSSGGAFCEMGAPYVP